MLCSDTPNVRAFFKHALETFGVFWCPAQENVPQGAVHGNTSYHLLRRNTAKKEIESDESIFYEHY